MNGISLISAIRPLSGIPVISLFSLISGIPVIPGISLFAALSGIAGIAGITLIAEILLIPSIRRIPVITALQYKVVCIVKSFLSQSGLRFKAEISPITEITGIPVIPEISGITIIHEIPVKSTLNWNSCNSYIRLGSEDTSTRNANESIAVNTGIAVSGSSTSLCFGAIIA